MTDGVIEEEFPAPRYCPWCGSHLEQWGHDDNCKRPDNVSLHITFDFINREVG